MNDTANLLRSLLIILLGVLGSCRGCANRGLITSDGQSAFGDGASPPRSGRVRIGTLPYSSNLPFFVALDQDYFRAAGADVEEVRFSGSNALVDQVIAGGVEVGIGVGLSTVLVVASKQTPPSFSIFLPLVEDDSHAVSALLVGPTAPVRSVADLRGRVVGTYADASQRLYLELLLRRLGLDPAKDVKLQQVDAKMQVESLASGHLDALLTVEPYVTLARLKGKARVLVERPRTQYLLNPFPAGANLASARLLKDRLATAKAVYAALARAVAAIDADPTAARRALVAHTPTDEPTARETGLYRWVLAAPPEPLKASYEAAAKLGSLLVEAGILQKLPPTDLWVDQQLIDATAGGASDGRPF